MRQKYFMHDHTQSKRSVERRTNRGYFIPTLYLSLEVLIGFLLLYIVHGGAEIIKWNPIVVGIVLLYLIASSLRRYIRVLRRTRAMRKHSSIKYRPKVGHSHSL